MQVYGDIRIELERHGICRPGTVHWNLAEPELYEEAIKRGEGKLAQGGPLVVRTGKHTGRAPKDRFIVRDPPTGRKIAWGEVNKPFDLDRFEALHERLLDHLEGRELFVQDSYVCAHPRYRMPIRVITEYAWHSLFARNQFIRPETLDHPHEDVEFTVIAAPSFQANPERDGTRSETVILLDMSEKLALIGGSSYGGEVKKAVFTMLNFHLPERDVFPMHCSANIGERGDVALFFGLSGTGKTTLSTEPHRRLIGDDEHGWFEGGVFNFEGGCYAKVIDISAEDEPEIYRASTQFGTVLENVVIDPDTRAIDFDSDELTENTRATYPVTKLEHVELSGVGGVPRTVFMLSYDAFGVLPPIAKLDPEQAMRYFLLGYTAKVGGTERGVTEPQATFSSCFGAPFLPRPPEEYAQMLKERMERHGTSVWFLNTGITGGPYGVGRRMPLLETRALVHAALDGTLEEVPFEEDPTFGLQVPSRCPDVSSERLHPRRAWDDPRAYDEKARELAERFEEEFEKFDAEF